MAYSPFFLSFVFARTDGACHLCGGALEFQMYGCLGGRGAWEVDHDVPRAAGGGDGLDNLLAAHIPCNRSKQATPSSVVRYFNGLMDRPLSATEKQSLRMSEAFERLMMETREARERSLTRAGVALGFGMGGAVLGALACGSLGTSPEDSRSRAVKGALAGGLACALTSLLVT